MRENDTRSYVLMSSETAEDRSLPESPRAESEPSRGEDVTEQTERLLRDSADYFSASKDAVEPTVCESLSSPGVVAFIFLGLFNNAIFVIMNSIAKDISAGSVALVYLANVVPTFAMKLSGPYWFHLASYDSRAKVVAVLNVVALLTVALGEDSSVQLVGIGVSSLAGGLGEPTMLALATKPPYNSRAALTAWSSGTGIAGIFGYCWTWFFTILFNLSARTSVLYALSLPLAYYLTYVTSIKSKQTAQQRYPTIRNRSRLPHQRNNPRSLAEDHPNGYVHADEADHCLENHIDDNDDGENGADDCVDDGADDGADEMNERLTMRMKVDQFLSLWYYMLPLFLVYASEYAMQSGAWAAIGFPIDSAEARKSFYLASNFAYQVGVFLSRSSAILFTLDLNMIFILPLLQTLLLLFFVLDALYKFLWQFYLLIFLSFIVGTIGGLVYVNTYIHITAHVPPKWREFSVAAASIADTIGIITANFMGLAIQGCLYRYNNIDEERTFCCGSC